MSIDEIDFDRELLVIATVISKFNDLETRMSRIITKHIGADAEGSAFVEKYVLHNSVVPFGSKVKLLLAINSEIGGPSIDSQPFHRLMQIRNAFAHGSIGRSIRFNKQLAQAQLLEGIALDDLTISPHLVIESMKGDGCVVETDRTTAFREFSKKYDSAVTVVEGFERDCDLADS